MKGYMCHRGVVFAKRATFYALLPTIVKNEKRQKIMDLFDIKYDHPGLNDGPSIYQLVTDCPPLDINSQYYYYIFCRDFRKTCVLAKFNEKVVGFISSYVKPEDERCLFIWQVAVLTEVRQKKIASTMLRWLIQQPACNQVTSLEVTVSPTNHASHNLFKHFAQECITDYQITTFLAASQFHNQVHEEELLLKIPINWAHIF